jgi:hypothetical protein
LGTVCVTESSKPSTEEAMPKVRQVLNHLSAEPAQRKRKCYRKPAAHEITKGEVCLVITDSASGGKSNYCPGCAEPILEKVQKDLDRLRIELEL